MQGWQNIDKIGPIVHDLKNPLPYEDGSAEIIYCSHVLEHMPRRAAVRVLKDFRRVLWEKGRCRIVVPDFGLAFREYQKGGQFFFQRGLQIALEGATAEQKLLTWVVRYSHEGYVGGPSVSREAVANAAKRLNAEQMIEWIVSHQTPHGAYIDHCGGYTETMLKQDMQEAGFRVVLRPTDLPHLTSRPKISIVADGYAG
jgi:SAM-dependent methyltransferase